MKTFKTAKWIRLQFVLLIIAILPACNEIVAPTDIEAGIAAEDQLLVSAALGARADAQADLITPIPVDLRTPEGIDELLSNLRDALEQSPLDDENRMHLRRSIGQLVKMRAAIGRAGSGESEEIQTASRGGGIQPDDAHAPEAFSYMNHSRNSGGHGYTVSGTTYTDSSYRLRINHQMTVSLGSLTRGASASSGLDSFLTTSMNVTCGSPETVSGSLVASLDWRDIGATSENVATLNRFTCIPDDAEFEDKVETVEDPGTGGGGGDITQPRTRTCLVRYWYDKRTGEVIHVEIIYCD